MRLGLLCSIALLLESQPIWALDPCEELLDSPVAVRISVSVAEQWEPNLITFSAKRLLWEEKIDWTQYFGQKIELFEETGQLKLAPDAFFLTNIDNNRPVIQVVQPDSENSDNVASTIQALRQSSTAEDGTFIAEFGAIIFVTEKRVLRSEPYRGHLDSPNTIPAQPQTKAIAEILAQIPVGEKILEIHNLHTHPTNMPLHASEGVLGFVSENTAAFEELKRDYGGSEPWVHIWAVPYRSNFSFVHSTSVKKQSPL